MTTTAQWADLLRRIKEAKIPNAAFMGNNLSVGLEGDWHVQIVDAGNFRSVRLYRRRMLMESWDGIRGLNETVTAVRRAQLAVSESISK